MDIRIKNEDDLADKITKTEKLRQPFHEIFKTKQKSHVFDVKTRVRPGGKAFKLEFAVKIATSLHPADYIQIFDELSDKKDPQIQDALIDSFDLDNDPEIHIWEARYEKVEKAK